MTCCSRCDAQLSAWEEHDAQRLGVRPCWCGGIPRGVASTLANLAYAELSHTDLSQPVKTHDVVRFVAPKYHSDPRYSINVTLSSDKRFCWGGRALYGLARHGLIPGPRSLAEAAYAVLLAAPRQLHVQEVDFVLEQLNYRFNADSLFHHLRGYTSNRWDLEFKIDHLNRVWVNSGRDAQHRYNASVGACPTDTGFDTWIESYFAPKVSKILDERTKRLADLKGTNINIAGDHIEFI